MSTAPAERHGGGQEYSVLSTQYSVRAAEPSVRGTPYSEDDAQPSVGGASYSVGDAQPSVGGASYSVLSTLYSPSSRPALPLIHLAILLPLCAFLFFLRLPNRDLWSSHEARAAQNAQAILDDGNWALPRLYDGRPELQKPPLYYWLVAAVGWCNDGHVEGWAVRLPAALSATACVLGLWLLGWRRGRPVAGFVAAAVLATAVHFTWLARVGRIDMPLTLAVGVAVAGMYLASGGRKPPGDSVSPSVLSPGGLRPPLALLIAYLALAAGLLLKGPIAAVLAAGVVSAHLLIERALPLPRQLRRWWRLAHDLGVWWGVPLALAPAAGWLLWADAQTGGDFLRTFVWHHNVERAFGGSTLLRGHPWWFYGPHFASDFLPWSVLLPVALVWSFRRGRWRDDPDARFGLAWLVAVLVLLSCVRFKRADYLLPAYPGAALFLGCVAERWYQHGPRRLLAGALAVVLLGGVVGWAVQFWHVLPRKDREQEWHRFAAEVRRRAPQPAPVLFFRTEAHALAFHVGRPLDVFVEWDQLDAWAARPEPVYVVMPRSSAAEWPACLHRGRLETVLDSEALPGSRHDRPLVLLRTRPQRN